MMAQFGLRQSSLRHHPLVPVNWGSQPANLVCVGAQRLARAQRVNQEHQETRSIRSFERAPTRSCSAHAAYVVLQEREAIKVKFGLQPPGWLMEGVVDNHTWQLLRGMGGIQAARIADVLPKVWKSPNQ